MANPTKKENICGNMLTERKNDCFFFSKNFDPPKKIFFRPKYFSSKNKILKKNGWHYEKNGWHYERGEKITEIMPSVLQWKEHECSVLSLLFRRDKWYPTRPQAELDIILARLNKSDNRPFPNRLTVLSASIIVTKWLIFSTSIRHNKTFEKTYEHQIGTCVRYSI